MSQSGPWMPFQRPSFPPPTGEPASSQDQTPQTPQPSGANAPTPTPGQPYTPPAGPPQPGQPPVTQQPGQTFSAYRYPLQQPQQSGQYPAQRPPLPASQQQYPIPSGQGFVQRPMASYPQPPAGQYGQQPPMGQTPGGTGYGQTPTSYPPPSPSVYPQQTPPFGQAQPVYGQPHPQQTPPYGQYARQPFTQPYRPQSSSWATQSRPSWQPVGRSLGSGQTGPWSSSQRPYGTQGAQAPQGMVPYGQYAQGAYGQQYPPGAARPYSPYPQQTGPWSGQYYAPGQWPPPKQGLAGRTIIVLILVSVLVIAPIFGSFIALLTNPETTVAPPTQTANSTYTPPTGPATPGSGQSYTPGPPDPNPNDPPFPTDAQIPTMLEANPFYNQSVSPIDCEITSVDLVNGSVDEIEEYMNEFVGCLMETWHPPITAAGFQLPRPSVTVYTHEISSACGDLPMGNAEYCAADQQIYYAKDLIQAIPLSLRSDRFVAESIIAHEFGHALQYRTMILMSEAIEEQNAGSPSAEEEWSRRTEMQADCFAGVFFNSVKGSTGLTQDDESNIVSLFYSLGGSTPYSDDHGTGDNRAAWSSAGLASSSPGVCNTFTADPASVS